ncbi:tripartite tricarboxylate transporter substrate binding protein [Calidifontimicrobium sp. SYSU G02091]|uniref:Bug family tripartite tricarboxylate transporter substrate binding protein n=1 Tax=Calidifontimicrobium sp. SYSU G02091 TaxID=2926421 RepID=UPI001F5382AA|nr:tripartite tricarboxylate transporter substrate binding protein [Calidifontimicrobium sp. SYSU G02091]MCI1193291.1 tripartite tricarboxylate transporter substrate binding protein [Calidifontimicrobium sp. SYSU G02091]
MHRRFLALIVLALATTPWLVTAQTTYPTKQVKFIVPYAPGGLPDTVARAVAHRLTARLGHEVVVDNKPGGNGVVAYQALMQSTPSDGHSFIVSDGSMLSITPLVNKSVPYQVGRDILPVSLIARSPLYVVAHPKTGVSNFAEFVALVKSKPDEFTYGSSGIGSTHHLTMEALKAALDLKIRHIPFRGSGQSTPALVGGQVDFSVAALPSMLGFVKANQVRLLASNAPRRSPQAPDVPAIAETVPGFDFAVVIGVMAAAGTPQPAIDRIAREIAEVVKDPELVKTFETAVIEPVGAGPAEYGRVIAGENERMARAAKVADLKAE